MTSTGELQLGLEASIHSQLCNEFPTGALLQLRRTKSQEARCRPPGFNRFDRDTLTKYIVPVLQWRRTCVPASA